MVKKLLLAGLLAAALLLLLWLLLRSFGAERALHMRLADALAEQMDEQLHAQHRELVEEIRRLQTERRAPDRLRQRAEHSRPEQQARQQRAHNLRHLHLARKQAQDFGGNQNNTKLQ